MQIILKDNVDSYLEGYKQFKKLGNINSTELINSTKEDAIDNFVKLGFPTIKDEDWRFTNILPIVKSKFNLQSEKPVDIGKIDLNKYIIPELNSHLMVFVDGIFSKELSNIKTTDSNVKIKPISESLSDDSNVIDQYIFKCADI